MKNIYYDFFNITGIIASALNLLLEYSSLVLMKLFQIYNWTSKVYLLAP